MSERISELLLERFVLGELSAHERAALEERLAGDPELAARVEALRADDAAVLEALPPVAVAAEVDRRDRIARAAERANARARQRVWLGAGGVVAAAAALLLVFVVLPGGSGAGGDGITAPAGGGDRVKGDPRLLAHLKRDGRVIELDAGATARAGDLVQLSYIAAGKSHGVILSIDGGGAVTLHHPETPDGSTELEGGGAVGLAHSYELDDAPAFERFFFVTSDRPIDVTDLVDRAEALAARADRAETAPLALPAGASQTGFLLRKESSR